MPTPKKLQCRHIFPDGHRCGSPCLRHEPFCYYHHTTRKPKTRATSTDTHSLFELPDLEDRSAIQSAITLVLQRLANGNLDPKRAGLLLYGLQIASSNLPKLMDPDVKPVEDIVEDPTHGTIARESYIDTAMVDAFSDILCARMGLPLQAAAEEQTDTSKLPPTDSSRTEVLPSPESKSRPNPQAMTTLRQNRPRYRRQPKPFKPAAAAASQVLHLRPESAA